MPRRKLTRTVVHTEPSSIGQIVETLREYEPGKFVRDLDLHRDGKPPLDLASDLDEHGARLYTNGMLTALAVVEGKL